MYMARLDIKGKPCFILRESCHIDGDLTFRNLFNIGADPSAFICYAGGNGFYFDERLEDALAESGVKYDSDALENLFWPWIRPDIRRAVDTFRNRSRRGVSGRPSEIEKQEILKSVHSFDKRRAHYLKFGNMDQGPVENMPAVLFRDHLNKSRDEIEQDFYFKEQVLETHELKSYVYAAFDLQHFFSGMLARKMPQALDQDRVERFFLEEVCRINLELFKREDRLDSYMIRYVIMFFDYLYADTTLLDDLARDFMARHRFFTPRPETSVSIKHACEIFNISKKDLADLTIRELTRIYRTLARKRHPDAGGSHGLFVELNRAYETLMGRLKTHRNPS